jgi:hypothetical protein
MFKNEEELFNSLKRNLIKDLIKKDQYSRTDCSSVKYDSTIELKCRNTHYQELLIEKDKYDALMDSPTKNKRYINSTPEGVFSFDITKINNIEWFDKSLPTTTEFDRKEWRIKKVGLLDINDAKNITELLN